MKATTVVAISGSPPNLSAVPAGSTDAHRPIDCRHTHPKWVHPLGEVIATKQPAAERALEPGMRPTAVDTAEARVVAALDAAPVLEVLCEVVAFGRAGLARTDSLVPFDEVGMLSTKCPAAVLAIVLRGAMAAREAAADLAGGVGHSHSPSDNLLRSSQEWIGPVNEQVYEWCSVAVVFERNNPRGGGLDD